MNFTLKIHKLGSVEEADIKVRPFTLLYGENNLNKSYVLLAIYYIQKLLAIGKSFWELESSPLLTEEDLKDFRISKNEAMRVIKGTVLPKGIVLPEGEMYYLLDTNIIEQLLNRKINKYLGNFFEYMLLLPRQQSEDWQIEIKLEHGHEKYLIIRTGGNSFIRVCLKEKREAEVMITHYSEVVVNLSSVGKWIENTTRRREKEENKWEDYLSDQFINCIRGDITLHPVLIPPSSSCLTDFANFLSVFALHHSFLRMFKENIDVSLPGLYREIMHYIFSPLLIKGSSNTAEKAKKYFRELFGFEITQEKNGLKFKDLYRNIEGNVAFASSSIKELLPIYSVLDRGFVGNLFIEEPEAHLHPWNQIRMAYFLATLVNLGYNLVITSHSDYLVSSIGSLVGLETLKKMEPQEFNNIIEELPINIKEEYLISADKVGVYWFRQDKNKVKVEQVNVDRNGIPLKTFEEPTDFLYDLTEKLLCMED